MIINAAENIVDIRQNIDGLEYEFSYVKQPLSQAGYRYDLAKDQFILQDINSSITFKTLPSCLIDITKAFFADAIVRLAEATVLSIHKTVRQHILVFEDQEDCIEDQIKRCFQHVMNSTEVYFGDKSKLRIFYRWCAQESMPHFDQDFVDLYLDEMQFGSNPMKGMDVIIQMENRGNLTLKEQRLFKQAVKKADYHSFSGIELMGFVSLRIGQVTGARDIQIRNLKQKHLKKSENGTNYLEIPRAKQRGRSARKQVKKRLITPLLAEQIRLLIEFNNESRERKDRESFLINTLNSNIIISQENYIYRQKKALEALNIDFTVTNRRLRKTFCTNLVASKTPLKTIAELMDHSDLQQLQVYYRQTKDVAEKIDVVLRNEASEILDIFAGKVIEQGEETNRGQQIFAPVKGQSLHLIGSCGSDRNCSLNPPLSCYSCPSLEAFRDADHEAVLETITENTLHQFGDEHAVMLAQDKSFLAVRALITSIEDEEYDDE